MYIFNFKNNEEIKKSFTDWCVDLLKGRGLTRKKVYVRGKTKGYFAFRTFGRKKKASSGKYYTPDYIISVPFPALAHASEIWSEVAKEVLASHGNPSGYKEQMMPIFNEIKRKVIEHKNYRTPSVEEDKDIYTLNNIKKNPPKGVEVKASWDEIVDRHLKEKYGNKVLREEYNKELPGMIAHYNAHVKKYSTEHIDTAKEKADEKKYSKQHKQYIDHVLREMVSFFNDKNKNFYNLSDEDRKKELNEFYDKHEISEYRKKLAPVNKIIEDSALEHFKNRSQKKRG